MAIDTSGMITVAQAAERLKLSQEQVRRNLRDGKLRGQRVGNQWFVDERDTLSDEEKTKRPWKPLIDPALLEEIFARRKELAKRGPLPDVVEMLYEDREDR
jgi:excisionase family DNA binding protein